MFMLQMKGWNEEWGYKTLPLKDHNQCKCIHDAFTVNLMSRFLCLSIKMMKIHWYYNNAQTKKHKQCKRKVYHNFLNKIKRLIIENNKMLNSVISIIYANAKTLFGTLTILANIHPVKETKTTVKTVNNILKMPISSITLFSFINSMLKMNNHISITNNCQV